MGMVAEYDTKFLMPLLVATFHLESPSFIDPIDEVMVTDEDSILAQWLQTKLLCMGC